MPARVRRPASFLWETNGLAEDQAVTKILGNARSSTVGARDVVMAFSLLDDDDQVYILNLARRLRRAAAPSPRTGTCQTNERSYASLRRSAP